MRRSLGCLSIALFGATAALAYRAPTPEEAAEIARVLAEEGCEGGAIEVDDEAGQVESYEIDDTRCGDVLMDYELDPSFVVISSERAD